MHHALLSLLGLAGLIVSGAAFGHPGLGAHSHPHPDLDTLLLIVVVAVGVVAAVLYIRRVK
jgi:hypothetical protein